MIFFLIPTLNEADSISFVLDNLEKNGIDLSQVCVADNGSSDETRQIAASRGCMLSLEPKKGYGSTCLKGMALLQTKLKEDDILVFLDGDGSDQLNELPSLLEPISSGRVEFTIGSRMLGGAVAGSMSPVQRFGNSFTSFLMGIFFGTKTTDLGPFRAIRWGVLQSLKMEDPNFGWTVEMQIKAAKLQIPVEEIPVSYFPRFAGRSKVSGTILGSIKAGIKILYWVFREWNFGRSIRT